MILYNPIETSFHYKVSFILLIDIKKTAWYEAFMPRRNLLK
jgi:hypothetical protein